MSELELEVCYRRYANYKNNYSYLKLFKQLEIAPPDDFVDPEQRTDRLPQPYRMITNLIEAEILEPAWELISGMFGGSVSGSGAAAADSDAASQQLSKPTSFSGR